MQADPLHRAGKRLDLQQDATVVDGVCVEIEHFDASQKPEVQIAMARWLDAAQLRVMVLIAGRATLRFHKDGQTQAFDLSSPSPEAFQAQILEIRWAS